MSLFGGGADSKLIVSMSFGSFSNVKWQAKSVHFSRVGSAMVTCSSRTGKSRTTLCTTDSGLEREPINVAFRWFQQHTSSWSTVEARSGVLLVERMQILLVSPPGN